MTQLPIKSNGILLHHQLFTAIKHQILNGTFREGEKLPTQDALCRQYGVSRITVRRAVTELQKEGLIRSEQGVGSFVLPVGQRTTPSVNMPFVEGLRRIAQETRPKVLKVEMQRPPVDIAKLLHLPLDAQALHVVRINHRNDVHLSYLDAWIPANYAGRINPRSLSRTPILELIASDDMPVGPVIQEITAEAAEPHIAEALRVPVNSPLLRMNRLVHNEQDTPVFYQIYRVSPEHTRLVMQVPGQEISTLAAGYLLHDVVGSTARS